jgi:hypothetical protein
VNRFSIFGWNMSNDDQGMTREEARQTKSLGYLGSLAHTTEGVPGEEMLLEQLEGLRNRLATVIEQIHSADERQLKAIHDELGDELRKTAGRLEEVRQRSQAAIMMAGADEAQRKAEANRRANSSASPHQWDELSKDGNNTDVQKAIRGMDAFIRKSNELNEVADKIVATLRKQIVQAARQSTSAVRKAMRRARLFAAARWTGERVTYLVWSLIFGAILLDLFQQRAEHEFEDFMKHPTGLGPNVIEYLVLGGNILLICAVWFLFDQLLKPYLEKWQTRIQQWVIARFASDVFNASFIVRIHSALAHTAYLDAVSLSSSPTQRQVVTLLWRAPRIEDLKGLNPLPEIVKLLMEDVKQHIARIEAPKSSE